MYVVLYVYVAFKLRHNLWPKDVNNWCCQLIGECKKVTMFIQHCVVTHRQQTLLAEIVYLLDLPHRVIYLQLF
jgi:hypothetical protein